LAARTKDNLADRIAVDGDMIKHSLCTILQHKPWYEGFKERVVDVPYVFAVRIVEVPR
jgi:hypothetical protein